MSQSIEAISDAEFDSKVLKSEAPVLVDFWAEWCGPCKAVAPVIASIAEEFNGRVKFVKVNVDQNPNTPAQFGVRGIPNLILFKSGSVVASKVGALTKAELTEFLNENC